MNAWRKIVMGFGIALVAGIGFYNRVEIRRHIAERSAVARMKFHHRLASVWSKPLSIAGFQSAAISANGKFIVAITRVPNVISVYQQDQRLVWSHSTEDIGSALISNDGKFVLAFTALDPLHPTIRVYSGPKGAEVTDFRLDGAVWDVDISNDGTLATVVTGTRSLYRIHLTSTPTLDNERLVLAGIGNSVATSADGKYVAAGTWDESGVSISDGVSTWKCADHLPGQPAATSSNPVVNRLFEAQIAYNDRYILGISYRNLRHSAPYVYLWSLGAHGETHGSLLWAPRELGADTIFPKAMITANGQYIALTYLTSVVHNDRKLQERHLLVLDHYGNEVCSLPGFLLSPHLVAVSADGSSIIVHDGKRALYSVTPDGRMSLGRTMPSTIMQTIASEDGRFILVYTRDGNLNLYRIA